MKKQSCYNCEERYVGCHNVCPIYLNYKLTLEKIRDTKIQESLKYPSRRKVYAR